MKRILIVRTDRLGDVVLSTPTIKAVRDFCPNGYIAMMVSPQARDIVEGNPYLNEVIVFDKKKFKGLFGAIRFAGILRKRNFDTVLVLHPVKRIHIILWLAGIRRRFGFDKKWGFLLTDRIEHTKEKGEKHEIDYNLDVLRAVGIEAKTKELFVPVKKEDRVKIDRLLKENGFSDKDEFVVLHPAASCPSKRWPSENFGRVADEVIRRFHKKIVIVTGVNDRIFGQKTAKAMKDEALDLSGNLSVGELAALLERAKLLISNDSGPMHIAVALGVPVVALFGRKEPGLSFKRWGPVGKYDVILHKDVGCVVCLAHNCRNDFKCIRAIETEEVIEAAARLLDVNA